MSKILLQLHATPSELLKLVSQFVHDENVSVAGASFPPFRASALEPQDLEEVVTRPEIERLVLSLHPIALAQRSIADLLAANSDPLVVDIGRQTKDGLQESAISARPESEAAQAAWQRFATMVKKATKAGATAYHPQTGATSRLRAHRYTDGAKALEESGVLMLPTAGVTRLRFD